jgi:hypothetical protein
MHYFSMIDLLSHLSIGTNYEHVAWERVVPKGKVERLIPDELLVRPQLLTSLLTRMFQIWYQRGMFLFTIRQFFSLGR